MLPVRTHCTQKSSETERIELEKVANGKQTKVQLCTFKTDKIDFKFETEKWDKEIDYIIIKQ